MAERTEFDDLEENDNEKTVINTLSTFEAEDETVMVSDVSAENEEDQTILKSESTDFSESQTVLSNPDVDAEVTVLNQAVNNELTKTQSPRSVEDKVMQSTDTFVEEQTTQAEVLQETQVSPGAVLKNRFDLLEVIGQGGMGKVYKALDKRDVEAGNTKFIAIKIINDQFKSDNNLLKALHAETRKTQALAHPNIVTVYDFDRDDHTVFMTMEFIEGIPLNQVIKAETSGLKVDEVLHLIDQIGSALVYAHSQHIIHLDLKPSNIFIDANKHIKIFDFGISRVTNVFQAKGFDAGVLGGLTPSYASLEMFNGESPDPRDDVYALACMTYELLTGKHPYNRERADKVQQKKIAPQRISKLHSKQWKTLIHGLALERKDRIQNVESFLQGMRLQNSNKSIITSAVSLSVIMVLAYFTYSYFGQANRQPEITKTVESEVISNIPDAIQDTTAIADIPIQQQQTMDVQTTVAETMEPSNLDTNYNTESELLETEFNNDLTLSINQPVFKIGEQLQVEFTVKKPLYVSIAIINSKNVFSMLFPNPYQLNNYCSTGVNYQIPPLDAEFNINVEGPAGTDQMIAVTSENPIVDDLLTQFDSLDKLTTHLSQIGLQYTISSYQITE